METWHFADTGELHDDESIQGQRPCIRCSRWATEEGYDACMGFIEGAKSVCCGHGVSKGLILWDSGEETELELLGELGHEEKGGSEQ